jgi:hypothetical protein
MRVVIAAFAVLVFAFAPAMAQELEIPENGFVVSDDLTRLPEAVRSKLLEIHAIANSGDIAQLAPILEADRTNVSFGGPEDPLAHLKQESADKQGIEILAILADLLEAPYAAMDGGDGQPIYVWPYLAAYESLGELTPGERVDAYQIMGHAAFEEMKGLDAWYFWRVYIDADGQLQAFVAGD